MKKTILALVLMAASTARAQIVTDIELGYRWVDVVGSEDMYRTQINEREGVTLKGLTLQTADFGGKLKFMDHLRLDATDIGNGPAGLVRLEAGWTDQYRLNFSYSRRDHYSALLAYANPLLSKGIIPGQHTIDRTRDTIDAELEIFPNRVVTPIVGYTYSKYDGPGTTSMYLGNDEFRLNSNLTDKEQEFRIGLGFNAGWVYGRITQGWRKYEGEETVSLVPGAGGGNNSNPVLGKEISVSKLLGASSYESEAPVTNGIVTFRMGKDWRFVVSAVGAKDELDATDQGSATGQLVSFALARFFTGWNESVLSSADNKHWRATGRLEGTIAKVFDVSGGITRRESESDGLALIQTLYLGTTDYQGLNPGTIEEILKAKTTLDRIEDIYDASLAIRAFGPFSLRAGYTQVDQDITITQDPSEIVIRGAQGGGQYLRRVKRFDGAATFSLNPVTLSAQYRTEYADKAVVRTDFIDRDTLRFRASLDFSSKLRIFGVAEHTGTTNDRTGYGFDGSFNDYRYGVEYSPVETVTLSFSGGQNDASTSIPIRRPYDFGVENSVSTEDGKSVEVSGLANFKPINLRASYLHFENSGSLPLTINRARVDVTLWFSEKAGVSADWAWDKYRELSPQPLHGDYEASRYGIYLRFRQ